MMFLAVIFHTLKVHLVNELGFVREDNPVRVIDIFINNLVLQTLGSERVRTKASSRPAYHFAIRMFQQIGSKALTSSKIGPAAFHTACARTSTPIITVGF